MTEREVHNKKSNSLIVLDSYFKVFPLFYIYFFSSIFTIEYGYVIKKSLNIEDRSY